MTIFFQLALEKSMIFHWQGFVINFENYNMDFLTPGEIHRDFPFFDANVVSLALEMLLAFNRYEWNYE